MDEDLYDGLTRENYIKRTEWFTKWSAVAERVHHSPNLAQKFKVRIGVTNGMKYPYVQVESYRPDIFTGLMGWGGGGKAYISEFCTESEFFQTVLGLGIAYVQHEYREGLFVDGARPFHPHIHTAALAEASKVTDARKVPTTEADS